jgi:hydroxymethylbilane synthase
MSIEKITLGTRGSELALTQTNMVTAELQTAFPHLRIERQIIQTSGDKRQDLRFSEFSDVAQVDKGIFIKELEIALENGQIDAAVHSLKDVPSDLAAGFTIAAVLPRAAIEDVLITAQPSPWKHCRKAHASAPAACAVPRSSSFCVLMSRSSRFAATCPRA